MNCRGSDQGRGASCFRRLQNQGYVSVGGHGPFPDRRGVDPGGGETGIRRAAEEPHHGGERVRHLVREDAQPAEEPRGRPLENPRPAGQRCQGRLPTASRRGRKPGTETIPLTSFIFFCQIC